MTTKIAYLDCFSGLSGDMMLGALVDAGVSIDELRRMLEALDLEGWEIRLDEERRDFRVPGIGVDVLCAEDHHHRTFKDIRATIEAASGLPGDVRASAVEVFHCLAVAEGKVHGRSPDEVHFHEVGAMDSIVDIVGSVAGLFLLGVDEVHCSPLPLGGGTVKCQHGTIPIPAPATVEILRGCPTVPGLEQRELVTPTGAALAKVLARSFGPPPEMTLDAVGYGLGTRPGEVLPNALRMLVGTMESACPQDRSLVLEANIDDQSPQFFGPLLDKLLEAGALDVTLTQVQMKKGRPGLQISVLCPLDGRQAMESILFRETTTIGVRRHEVARSCLKRSWRTVDTPYGQVRIKESGTEDELLNRMPEFEDCRKLADEQGVPIREVHEAAVAASRRRPGGG